jgi:hypothetical protein
MGTGKGPRGCGGSWIAELGRFFLPMMFKLQNESIERYSIYDVCGLVVLEVSFSFVLALEKKKRETAVPHISKYLSQHDTHNIKFSINQVRIPSTF